MTIFTFDSPGATNIRQILGRDRTVGNICPLTPAVDPRVNLLSTHAPFNVRHGLGRQVNASKPSRVFEREPPKRRLRRRQTSHSHVRGHALPLPKTDRRPLGVAGCGPISCPYVDVRGVRLPGRCVEMMPAPGAISTAAGSGRAGCAWRSPTGAGGSPKRTRRCSRCWAAGP